jgi:hypothetical protein
MHASQRRLARARHRLRAGWTQRNQRNCICLRGNRLGVDHIRRTGGRRSRGRRRRRGKATCCTVRAGSWRALATTRGCSRRRTAAIVPAEADRGQPHNKARMPGLRRPRRGSRMAGAAARGRTHNDEPPDPLPASERGSDAVLQAPHDPSSIAPFGAALHPPVFERPASPNLAVPVAIGSRSMRC